MMTTFPQARDTPLAGAPGAGACYAEQRDTRRHLATRFLPESVTNYIGGARPSTSLGISRVLEAFQRLFRRNICTVLTDAPRRGGWCQVSARPRCAEEVFQL